MKNKKERLTFDEEKLKILQKSEVVLGRKRVGSLFDP